MTNHVHLLVTPGSESAVSEMMQSLGRRYVRSFNMSHDRTGTLWEGRYRASLVDSESYLLTCMRYIELNPVRANMVAHPAIYRWSSYAHNAQGKPDPLLDAHPVYKALGKSNRCRCQAYSELFVGGMDRDTERDIRDALNCGLVLGRDEFKNEVERRSRRRTRPGRPGRPRAAAAKKSCG
jgi:putative transposase